MPAWTGSLGSSGSPLLKIRIAGVLNASGQDFDAIVDTGYTGFLAMPLLQAFPLGLILFGTTNLVLADGSTVARLTAYGRVSVESETQAGVIVLDPGSSEVLLGMEFLRTFKKALLLFPELQQVGFIDEADVKAALASVASTAASVAATVAALSAIPPPAPSESAPADPASPPPAPPQSN